MKKIIYLFRKFFGIIIILITIANILFVIFEKRLDREGEIYLYIYFFFFIIGLFIYPSRTKYCSCGRKYTNMNYEYVETNTCKSKINKNVKITPYQYNINIVYFCEHCQKEYKCSKTINGGEVIEYLDNGTYEDKKIPYDKAIESFIQAHQKRK